MQIEVRKDRRTVSWNGNKGGGGRGKPGVVSRSQTRKSPTKGVCSTVSGDPESLIAVQAEVMAVSVSRGPWGRSQGQVPLVGGGGVCVGGTSLMED